MNLMLASMLQRGSNEVKEKAQEMDAEGKESGTGFSALMAELAQQEHDVKQIDANSDNQAAAEQVDEDVSTQGELSNNDEETRSEQPAASSPPNGNVSVTMNEPLPDTPDNDLYTQITAAKKQDTSLSQGPTTIARSVREALTDAAESEVAPESLGNEQEEATKLSRLTEITEQPEKSAKQEGAVVKQTLDSTRAIKSANDQSIAVSQLNGEQENGAEQASIATKSSDNAQQGMKPVEPNTTKLQSILGADKAVDNEHSAAQRQEKPQPEIAIANQSKSAQQAKAEGPAGMPVDTKMNSGKQPSTVKNVTDVQTVVEKLTAPQQQELKAVMAGKLDIFDASPSVQKAVAQLIGKGMDMTSLSQFKMTTQAEAGTDDPESMTSEVKSDVKTVNVANLSANAEPKEASAKSTPTSMAEMKEKKVEQPSSGNEPKVLAEKANAEKQASEELADKELGKLAQAEASMAKETVKVERQQSAVVTPNTAKPEVSTLNAVQQDDTSLNQTLKEVQQVQQSQSTSNTAAQVKQAVDPHLQQAINIARQDAAKELHQRVGMMLNLNNKEAEIRLDPPELGAMQIRIKSDAEQAQVNIVVQNQQAKELLEQSMPRLREMLAEQGIELGDSQISHQQQSDAESDSQGGAGNQGGQLVQGDEEEISNGSSTTQKRNTDSAIDYYA